MPAPMNVLNLTFNEKNNKKTSDCLNFQVHIPSKSHRSFGASSQPLPAKVNVHRPVPESACVGASRAAVCLLFSGDAFSRCVRHDLVKREIEISEQTL